MFRVPYPSPLFLLLASYLDVGGPLVQALSSSPQHLLRRILSHWAFRRCLLTSKAQLVRSGLWHSILILIPILLGIIPSAFDTHGPCLDLSVPESFLGHQGTLGLSSGQQYGMYGSWLVSPQAYLLINCTVMTSQHLAAVWHH